MTPRSLTHPEDAALVLVAGGLVALPTETVYGLAAAADDPEAVGRVFAVKGRPRSHPLIVHLARAEDVHLWASEVPEPLERLLVSAWPGPLTVVLPKQPWVPSLITGEQNTVALRVPAHDLTRRVIAALGEQDGRLAAVVAPSANPFGAVSPTTAEHVLSGLGPRLTERDAILDGGPCAVGVESTIVDWSAAGLRVLRPGGFDVSGFDSAPATTVNSATGSRSAAQPRVPGTLPSHYAPRARVHLVPADTHFHEGGSTGAAAVRITETAGARIGLIAPAHVATPAGWHRLAAPDDDRVYARMLYSALREADQLGLSDVVAVPPGSGPLVAAIEDRLRRASATE